MVVRLAAGAAELSANTLRAFEDYTRKQEAAMDSRIANGGGTLIAAGASDGTAVQVEPFHSSPVQDVPQGLIHDWTGRVFIPGVSLERVIQVLQDYGQHAKIYAPSVISSKLFSRDANGAHTQLRMYSKKAVEVVLEAEFRSTFKTHSKTAWESRIRSVRISEVRSHGTRQEKILPDGQGWGFLWRMNSYWKLEQRGGGVWVELRSISLTRDIPSPLKWIIEPMVTSFPRETLATTLAKTRAAVQTR